MLPTTLSVHFLLTWKNLTFLPCKITLIPFVEIKLQKIPSRIPKSKLSNWILMEYKIHTWDPFGATSCRAGPEATPQGSYYITHAMGPIFKTVLEYVPKKYFVYEKRVSCFKICIAPCIPRDRHIHHVYLVYERILMHSKFFWQVYRLYQLGKAANFVQRLMSSMRGAPITPELMEKSTALYGMVVTFQVLGIVCLWSLLTFLIRLFPSRPVRENYWPFLVWRESCNNLHGLCVCSQLNLFSFIFWCTFYLAIGLLSLT